MSSPTPSMKPGATTPTSSVIAASQGRMSGDAGSWICFSEKSDCRSPTRTLRKLKKDEESAAFLSLLTDLPLEQGDSRDILHIEPMQPAAKDIRTRTRWAELWAKNILCCGT